MKLIKQYPIVAYFCLCYAFSWLVWGLRPSSNLGYFGPMFAAFLLTSLTTGKQGLKDLLAHLFHWRVSIKWYLIAILFIPFSLIIVAKIHQLAGNLTDSLPNANYWLFTFPKYLITMVAFAFLLTAFTAVEEIGWRGYALPKLQKKYHPLIASSIIGVLWGLWHIPTLLTSPRGYDGIDVLIFTGSTTSISVVYTWLYNSTNGSLLITSLFHSFYNTTVAFAGAIIPFDPTKRGQELIALMVIAIITIILVGPQLSYTIKTKQL